MSQLFTLYNHTLTPIQYTKNTNKPKLLTGSINSFGVINQHNYKELHSEIYTVGNRSSYPYMNFYGKYNLVSGVESYSSDQLLSSSSFRYEKGLIDIRGRGFLGFESVTQYDNLRGRNVVQKFDPLNFGVLISENTLFSENSYQYEFVVSQNKLANIKLVSKSELDKLNGNTIAYSYTYDSYNNPTIETTDFGNGVREINTNSYNNYVTDRYYRLGELASQTKRTERDGNTFSTQLVIGHNSNGLPTSKKEYINGNLVEEDLLIYDNAFRVTEKRSKVYDSGVWLSEKYAYDHLSRLSTKTSVLGLEEQYGYDQYGQLASLTKNGLTAPSKILCK